MGSCPLVFGYWNVLNMIAPLPPIYRDCRRVLVSTEDVKRRFSRHHKYTVGTDLRQKAFRVMRAVHRAVYDRAEQPRHIPELVGSDWSHFSHANASRLSFRLLAKHAWLGGIFDAAADAALTPNAPARWLVRRHCAVRQNLQPEGASTCDQ